MSLDAQVSRLTKHGTVSITSDSDGKVHIEVADFKADGCTCRDVAVQACLWAIGELSREALLNIERPGGGSTCVD